MYLKILLVGNSIFRGIGSGRGFLGALVGPAGAAAIGAQSNATTMAARSRTKAEFFMWRPKGGKIEQGEGENSIPWIVILRAGTNAGPLGVS